MRFYGLRDRENREVIEFHPCREAAERELAEILHDEPQWQGRFEVVLVDFAGPEVRVAPVSGRR